MEQIQRIISYLTIYLGEIKELDKVTLDIEEGIDRITAYCNRTDFPVKLEKILAKELSKTYLTDVPSGVSSITEGKTSIQFNRSVDFDSLIDSLKKTLWTYRRVGGVQYD